MAKRSRSFVRRDDASGPNLGNLSSGGTFSTGTLDRAVWCAYGWADPDPAAVDEDTILSRLLELNLERAGAVGVVGV